MKLACSVETAGKLLCLQRKSAYAAARNGHIRSVKIGGKIIIPLSWLAEKLEVDLQTVVAAVEELERPNRSSAPPVLPSVKP